MPAATRQARTLQRMELLKTGYMGTLSLGWDNYLFLELTGRQERSSNPKRPKVFSILPPI